MAIRVIQSSNERDLRLDLFRGIANWAIFVDHIPNNIVTWVTIRNYGFSDAADLFVFISGYVTSLVCASIMLNRGVATAAMHAMKRVWQLYVAHILLFVIYVVTIGYAAHRYGGLDLADKFNIASLIHHPVEALAQGLLLRFKPLNLDVLPLYIVLMAFLPPLLWLMLRAADVTMAVSLLVYLAARHFEWNLSAYPTGVWYFNPFAWQLLFVFGSWFALGGARKLRSFIESRGLLYFGTAYLMFSLAMTMAGRFSAFADILPDWLVLMFNPNDKTNLAPYRVLHLIVIVLLVERFVPAHWRALEHGIFRPFIKCGQHSLKVFCSGILLSFAAHFALEIGSRSVAAQILVTMAGIVLMTVVAYSASWFKKIEKRQMAPGFQSQSTNMLDASGRRQSALFAGLLAGPQSDRNGILEAEDGAA